MKHEHLQVICISGKAQHGKDTTAGFLKEIMEKDNKRVLIIHNADLLKFMCSSIFGWNGKKDDTGRKILQYVGTDVIRKEKPDYWVDYIIDIIYLFGENWDYVLIPDCRFPNEINKIRSAGFNTTHMRIYRNTDFWESPLSEEQQKHISETALDNVIPDIYVYNDDTLGDLRKNIKNIYEKNIQKGV